MLAIVSLIAYFQRSPERNRTRFERARDWITANATIVAAGVAVATGAVLVVRVAIP